MTTPILLYPFVVVVFTCWFLAWVAMQSMYKHATVQQSKRDENNIKNTVIPHTGNIQLMQLLANYHIFNRLQAHTLGQHLWKSSYIEKWTHCYWDIKRTKTLAGWHILGLLKYWHWHKFAVLWMQILQFNIVIWFQVTEWKTCNVCSIVTTDVATSSEYCKVVNSPSHFLVLAQWLN